MRLESNPNIHLTYCLNVHPGAGLADVHEAVRGPARELALRVCPDRPACLTNLSVL